VFTASYLAGTASSVDIVPRVLDLASIICSEIQYELVYSTVDNSSCPYDGFDTKKVHGVLLVQVLPRNQLKGEVFPGKSADTVWGIHEGRQDL
jgi:hypothetical protein